MPRFERRPDKVASWIAAGNEPPDAGKLKAFLKGRGVDADVSVLSDGTIVVDSDATTQVLTPALDAMEALAPDAPDPEDVSRAALVTEIRGVLAEIRATPTLTRSPAERAVLLMAALDGLDETPGAAVG